MKQLLVLPLTLAVLAFGGSLLIAQESEAGHAPDGNSFERLINITIPPVQHAPFSSVVTAEWTRTLEDGSTVTRQNHRIVIRDTNGRIYQERRSPVPKDSQTQPELMRIEISDPAQHTKYFCRPLNHVCALHDYQGPPAETTDPTGFAEDGSATLTREDLGKNTLSGVDVIGTRETRTIAAGAIGNDRPISISKEFWYSPQLGLNLLVKRNDPRAGVQIFTVTELSLSEPDPKYFQIPSDYKVVDMRSSAIPKPVAQVPKN